VKYIYQHLQSTFRLITQVGKIDKSLLQLQQLSCIVIILFLLKLNAVNLEKRK